MNVMTFYVWAEFGDTGVIDRDPETGINWVVWPGPFCYPPAGV
jgi:hypothetical protein